ncbi:MAG: hypothetical protein JNL32_04815 [Candidatus Kapabacteria bacterium]|nr:hypothetical protein [Candidatus Kapabacteria bacterium]
MQSLKFFGGVNSLSEAKRTRADLIDGMKYLSSCGTIEEAAAQRKKLAKKHHADTGAGGATMAEINAEFDTFTSIDEEYQLVVRMIETHPNLFNKSKAAHTKQAARTIATNFRSELAKEENRAKVADGAATIFRVFVDSLLKG